MIDCIVLPNNVDRSGKEMILIYLVRTVRANQYNRVRIGIDVNRNGSNGLKFIVGTPLKIILELAMVKLIMYQEQYEGPPFWTKNHEKFHEE
jgi:hypothetical protein